ncbi:MAG: hypothetical protein ACFCVD_17525 [Nodosilinea sp.]
MLSIFFVFSFVELYDFLVGIHLKLYEYIAFTYSELFQYPRWFLMRKLGRIHWIRHFFSEDFSSKIIVPDMLLDEQNSSLKCFASVDSIVQQLNNHGIFQGIYLKDKTVNEIKKFALEHPCYANRNPDLGFLVHLKELASDYISQEIRRANYYNLESQCAIISTLKADPFLRKIAALYLQTSPVHVSSALWWSFPSTSDLLRQSKAAQVFHCDLDDFRFLKFFFYLTDVDVDSGPHLFIRGSHRKKPFFRQLLRGRASEDWLLQHYGPENVLKVYGPAGFGFVEDTYGHHMGSPPKSNQRLILQIEYATHDYGNLHDMIDPKQLNQLPLGDVEPLVKSYGR